VEIHIILKFGTGFLLPASQILLVKYESGESLKCTDVRFVFVRIDIQKNVVASIIILTPEYIEQKFGRFGKPTVKQQLLISNKARKGILESEEKILSFPDSKKLSYYIRHDYLPPNTGMVTEPDIKNLFSIALIRKLVANELIGLRLDAAATKNRGQALEKKVLELLGYDVKEKDLLYGAFPDIKNQLLEVKVQDTQTVDLGRFSPEREEIVIESLNLTTFDVRYLIALTNPKTEIIEGFNNSFSGFSSPKSSHLSLIKILSAVDFIPTLTLKKSPTLFFEEVSILETQSDSIADSISHDAEDEIEYLMPLRIFYIVLIQL